MNPQVFPLSNKLAFILFLWNHTLRPKYNVEPSSKSDPGTCFVQDMFFGINKNPDSFLSCPHASSSHYALINWF